MSIADELQIEILNDKLAAAEAALAQPIPMILFCPSCGTQHVDAPEPSIGWENPPHRSHLCHACQHVWRPCDRPTNGVAAIETAGKGDSELPRLSPLIRLRAADAMAAVVDDWVGRGVINFRSALADTRLDYGEPFSSPEIEQRLLSLRTEAEAALAERDRQLVALRAVADDYRHASGRFSLFVEGANDEAKKQLSDEAKSARVRLLSVLRDTAAAAQAHDDAVRAEEREVCAKIAEHHWHNPALVGGQQNGWRRAASAIADDIRRKRAAIKP